MIQSGLRSVKESSRCLLEHNISPDPGVIDHLGWTGENDPRGSPGSELALSSVEALTALGCETASL